MFGIGLFKVTSLLAVIFKQEPSPLYSVILSKKKSIGIGTDLSGTTTLSRHCFEKKRTQRQEHNAKNKNKNNNTHHPKMKFLIATLLASFVSTIQGDMSILEARWKMDEPVISYNSDSNLFTADFPTASKDNVLGTGMNHIFFDYDCADDGTEGFDEYKIPAGITAPDGVSAPVMTLNGDGRPQLKFRINPQILANNDKIYSTVTTDPFQ